MTTLLKRITLLFLFSITTTLLFSQNVAINTTGSAPVTNGVLLDLSNNTTAGTMGFLPPYVNFTLPLNTYQLTGASISGVVVWNIGGTQPQGLYYWDNTAGSWISMGGGALTAANDGLSLNGTIAILGNAYGGTLGELTQNTELPFNGKNLTFSNVGGAGNIGIDLAASTSAAQALEIGQTNNTIRVNGLKAGSTFNVAPSTLTSYLLYANTNGDLYSMPAGATNNVLTWTATGPAWQAPAGGGITANNGLNMSTATNVQLGGPLVMATNITQAGFALDISGGTIGLNDGASTTTTNINTGTATGPVNIGNANNKVGIGTLASINKLTVEATTVNDGEYITNGTNWMLLSPGTLGNVAYNNIVQGGDNGIIFTGGGSGSGNFVIAPWANATSGLRITSNGYVGLSAVVPAQALEVGGTANTARIDGLATGNAFNIAPAATTNYLLYANGNGDLYSMPAGTTNNVLTWTATGPTWQAPAGNITANNGLNMSTATNVQLGGPLTVATNIAQSTFALDISGGTIGLNDGSSTYTTNINTGTSTGAVNIANGSTGSNAIAIGNNLGTTSILENVGTGNYTLNGVAGSTYTIGAATVGGTIKIGGTAQTGAITLGQSTAAGPVVINNAGSGTTTIDNAGTGKVIIGNNAATGYTGIAQATPKTTLDINGGLSTDLSAATTTTLTTTSTATITVGNSSYIQFTSTGYLPTSRPFTLSAGLQTGQRLVLQLTSPLCSGAALVTGGNVSLLNSPVMFGGGAGNYSVQALELIWNGSAWIDVGNDLTSVVPTVVTYTYTGAVQTWTSPACVTNVSVSVWGAGGAGSSGTHSLHGGGGGAYMTGVLTVTPLTTYTIIVGGGGTVATANAFGGGGTGTSADAAGGGGGYSGIFSNAAAQATAMVIAGGGGGGADGTNPPGNGGNYSFGGGGGAPTGGTGSGTQCGTETGGAGGSIASGGIAGVGGCNTVPGTAGTALQGGNKGAAKITDYGGGGGGGYFGGGSGGCNDGAGGGGGSSFPGASNATFTIISNVAGQTGTLNPAPVANPGGTTDPYYQTGIGVGSNAGNTVGGNGLVVISY